MVTAAWDTSNLVALYKDGLQCETCCLFAPSDCSCFTGSAWDSITAYVIGDTVVHEGIYYNCRTDNTNKVPPSNPTEWINISPYGGPGGTPTQISITVWGVINCDSESYRDPNGTHILDFTPSGPFTCRYLKLIPAGDGLEALIFIANLDLGQVGIASLGSGSLFEEDAPLFPCLLKQIITNRYTECNFPAPPFNVGYDGTVQWRMGACDPWDSGDNYIVGDCVGHEGTFYICNQDHINQEPPNGSYWAPVVV